MRYRLGVDVARMWAAFAALGLTGCSLIVEPTVNAADDEPLGDNVIFASGFETGLAPPWQIWFGNGTEIDLSQMQVYRGEYAARCSAPGLVGDAAGAYAAFDQGDYTTDIYIRQFLFLEDGFETDAAAGLGQVYTPEGSVVLNFWAAQEQLFVKSEQTGEYFSDVALLPVQKWFELEILFSSRPPGHVNVRIGGMEVLDEELAFATTHWMSSYVTCMVWHQATGVAHSLYLDDVLVEDRR